MRKELDMLFLVMCLLYWAPEAETEGACSHPIVSIFGKDRVLPAGESFTLSCEFTCLKPQHVAQLWRVSAYEGWSVAGAGLISSEDAVCLVNITSTAPSVIVVLSIRSATTADTGYYSCMTQPPDTLSSQVLIQIADNLTASILTISSPPQHNHTLQPSSTAGLQGQIWYWILLGKTTVLILSLAILAVTYRRR